MAELAEALAQMQRVMKIDELSTITADVVEAAWTTRVIDAS